MFKRLLLVALIALMPVQSWAVIGMSFQHQLNEPELQTRAEAQVLDNKAKTQAHSCHQQEMNPDSKEAKSLNKNDHVNCNSCALCMAFGLPFMIEHSFQPDSFPQRFHAWHKTFLSADIAAINKPPIL